MAEKRPGNSQGLSPSALRDKRARDKAYAMGKDWKGKDTSVFKRKEKKKENQAFVDKDGNKGQRSDSDIHHTKSGTQRRTSVAYNRATHTRNEVKS